MSPDIPPSRHTSPQAHRPWFSSWQPATVLSPPTSQNCHYLPHILPCHCQRQGMLNISQSLCSYTNCMQMCRLFPCVICIFLIILYRTAHAAAQTYDLYNVFHMVLRLKGSWKQKFLITVGVLMTLGDINVLYSRGLTEEVLIAICPNLLIWVKDTEVKNCHYTLWFNITLLLYDSSTWYKTSFGRSWVFWNPDIKGLRLITKCTKSICNSSDSQQKCVKFLNSCFPLLLIAAEVDN